MEHISRVLVVCGRGIDGKPPAREEEKARGDGGNFVSLFIEIHVLEALKRTGLQKARHSQNKTVPLKTRYIWKGFNTGNNLYQLYHECHSHMISQKGFI